MKSHFNGDYDVANLNHSDPIYFDVSDKNFQVASAKEINAYEDVEMYRTLVLWSDPYFEKPILLDLFSIFSKGTHTYDMPYQHAAQIMSQNFEYTTHKPKILGTGHGYQHLYGEAEAEMTSGYMQANLMKDDKFYTITAAVEKGEDLIFARLGANDVNFNLRRDALLIHRKSDKKNARFLSVIESHGSYSRNTEVPIQPYGKINAVSIMEESNESITFMVSANDENCWTFKMNKKTGKDIKIEKVICKPEQK
jgi:hypothetical protein